MNNITIPKTVYSTPNPELGNSEYYCVFAEILPLATHPTKHWVVKESHGWWDDVAKQAINNTQTLSPTETLRSVRLGIMWTVH